VKTTEMLAFECDRFGVVTQVLRDDRELLAGPGTLFVMAVAPHATERAFALIQTAAEQSAVFDWELPLRHGDEHQPWHFAATGAGDRLYVVATTAEFQTPEVMRELTRINNTHVNALREALAERARQRSLDTLLEEMTALNNELTATQRELSRKCQQLALLDRQKNELLGTVAHDLRNPLGVVLGYSQVLQAMVPEEGPQRQMVDAISRNAAFMSHLLDDLLDLAVIEAGHLRLAREQVDLGATAQHVVDLFRAVAQPKRITVDLAPLPAMSRVHADPVKLEQVLSNLLSNAIKFGDPESTVLVRVEARPDEVALEVHDQGPGIPVAQRERLFEPFQQGRARSTGGERSTGLGLAIVRRIVEGHGGRIEVQSEEGRGTCFRIVLPT
jgi:two-component system, OmpR family, sensor kinase